MLELRDGRKRRPVFNVCIQLSFNFKHKRAILFWIALIFFLKRNLSVCLWRSSQPARKQNHDHKSQRHHHKSGQTIFISKTGAGQGSRGRHHGKFRGEGSLSISRANGGSGRSLRPSQSYGICRVRCAGGRSRSHRRGCRRRQCGCGGGQNGGFKCGGQGLVNESPVQQRQFE